mmetsp:Transcript_13096/g.35270  ORF Transcript_13096/g.35270 Transcript_13096/m.35270 type:complete len:204 (-) Transcript_13096:110-721(-)
MLLYTTFWNSIDRITGMFCSYAIARRDSNVLSRKIRPSLLYSTAPPALFSSKNADPSILSLTSCEVTFLYSAVTAGTSSLTSGASARRTFTTTIGSRSVRQACRRVLYMRSLYADSFCETLARLAVASFSTLCSSASIAFSVRRRAALSSVDRSIFWLIAICFFFFSNSALILERAASTAVSLRMLNSSSALTLISFCFSSAS